MANKYVEFISDEHFIKCISILHKAYIKAQKKVDKKGFYENKIDTIKLTFDSHFNKMDEEKIIEIEILRQIDKSINNSIGSFHEQILCGINGLEGGTRKGYDIKAKDNTIFADIKNKHNTMNSGASESLFQKLSKYADENKKANCYWVQILAKGSFCEKWYGDINGKEYSHSRVFKISGDRFYALVSGVDDAFFQLYKALPLAIEDYMNSSGIRHKRESNSTLAEITRETRDSKRTILNQITFENYGYYFGFDKL